MCSTSSCGPRSGFGFRGFRRRPEGFGWGEQFMPHGHEGFGGFGGAGFGVRRPLRFLAYKLDLDERQVAELARLLDEVKTERAQAEVDDRRTLADFADALAGEAFDSVKAAQAGERRVASATRLRDAVNRFLQQIHALLNAEQRAKLAYLIRTGALAV
jgi:Spy/CpxP family protein refolding chaperone